MRKDRNDVTTIEPIVSDQGNGASYCTKCGNEVKIEELADRCPHCERKIVRGKYSSPRYPNFGGSDY